MNLLSQICLYRFACLFSGKFQAGAESFWTLGALFRRRTLFFCLGCKWCISLWVHCLCSFKVRVHAPLFPHTCTPHLLPQRSKVYTRITVTYPQKRATHFAAWKYNKKLVILFCSHINLQEFANAHIPKSVIKYYPLPFLIPNMLVEK